MIFVKYLFKSISLDEKTQFRNDSISRYGRLNVIRAESFSLKLSENFMEKLKINHDKIILDLYSTRHLAPDSDQVQELIGKHFNSINQYWGTIGTVKQHLDSYNDLANCFKSNPSFSIINENYQPDFATFMYEAMTYYIKKKLKKA